MDSKAIIKKRLSEKIKTLENNNGKEQDIERFKKIEKLVQNDYENFFEKIDANIAIAILNDIGINKDEAIELYSNLIKEDLSKKYTLLNLNLNEKEEEK